MTRPEQDPETSAGALPFPRLAGADGPVSTRSVRTGPRYTIHLRLVATDDDDAVRLADVAAGHLAEILPEVDRWSTEISHEDGQSDRRRVYCNRALPGGRRCDLPAGHRDSPCGLDPGPHWVVARRPPLDGLTWR